MKGLMLVANIEGRRYEIVDGLDDGYYVYRYFGQGPRYSHDYLQDDLETAIGFAGDRFRIPSEAWHEAKPEEAPAYLNKQEPLSKSQALDLVKMELSCIKTEAFAILHERTLEFHWGWTFFFDSKKYVETRDSRYKSPNRAAFMVDRQSAEMIKSPFSRLRIYYQIRYRRYRAKRRRGLPVDELKALMRKEWDLPSE